MCFKIRPAVHISPAELTPQTAKSYLEYFPNKLAVFVYCSCCVTLQHHRDVCSLKFQLLLWYSVQCHSLLFIYFIIAIYIAHIEYKILHQTMQPETHCPWFQVQMCYVHFVTVETPCSHQDEQCEQRDLYFCVTTPVGMLTISCDTIRSSTFAWSR